jgi:hypothetical protein
VSLGISDFRLESAESSPSPGGEGGRSRCAMVRIHFVFRMLRYSKTPVPITARQMAEEWEVSTKTIYRDIAALRQVGVNVVTHCGGHPGFTLASDACPFCGGPA